MTYEDFLKRVHQKAGLQRNRAEVATQAVLSVLGERLSEKEARDLASELPRELKRMLENVRGQSRGYLAREFVRLVAEREGVPEADARLHTWACWSRCVKRCRRRRCATCSASYPMTCSVLFSLRASGSRG